MNLLCNLGIHKWIGAHSHKEPMTKDEIASCVAGCVCIRCGFRPLVKYEPLPCAEDYYRKDDVQLN